MRSVNFQSLSITNFLSVGKEPVVVNFEPGVNIITGINYDKEDSKNGVGKSTIVEALYFALFGTTIRELNKDLIINSYNKQKCEVELIFSITTSNNTNLYKITRTLQPTKCYIFKDGVDVTRSTLPKTNEYIQTLINTTGKMFQNSVIMTVNNTTPFMAQSKTDKRKFIESTLNLQIFSDMLLKARDEHNEVKKDYEINVQKKETTEKHYIFNKQQLDLFETNKQAKITEISNKIESDNLQIENLKKQYVVPPVDIFDTLNQQEAELLSKKKEIEDMYDTTLQSKAGISTEIKILQKQLIDIEKKGAVCKECQRPFSDEDNQHKENTKQTLTNSINDLQAKENETQQNINKFSEIKKLIEKKISEIQNKKQEVNNIVNENNNIQNKITYIQENIKQLETNLENLKKEANTELEQIVKSEEEEILKLQSTIDCLNIQLDVLECIKFIVSEEGVKSYIVKKILKLLNNRLAFYLNAFEANCTCLFNEFFDETIIDEQGEEKSYFNFSGGERKRIDLACLFAFLDVRRMQGDVNFTTIFYDELLDSSLDDKGVTLVIKTLRERKNNYNESCYIITHRGSAVLSEVDKVINLEKRNGFTYLLE